LRMPPLGKLTVDVNETRYESINDVADVKLRQRLLAAVGELVAFAGGYGVLEEAGFAPQLTPPKTAAVEELETAVSLEVKQQQEAFLNSLERQLAVEKSQPVKKGRSGSADPIIEITESGAVKPIPLSNRPLTIAEQIDAILQNHIAADPAMAQRRIQLEQNPAGGLQIVVDGKRYEKPADIEDAEVQALIKGAVKEWNATK
jgi:hypothetical protein